MGLQRVGHDLVTKQQKQQHWFPRHSSMLGKCSFSIYTFSEQVWGHHMSLVSNFSLNWNSSSVSSDLLCDAPVTSTLRQGRYIFLLSGLRPSLMPWKCSAQKGKPKWKEPKSSNFMCREPEQTQPSSAPSGCNSGRHLSPEGTRGIEPMGPRWYPVEHTPVLVFFPPAVTTQAASQPLLVRSCQVNHLLPIFQGFQVNQDRKTKQKTAWIHASDFEWVR